MKTSDIKRLGQDFSEQLSHLRAPSCIAKKKREDWIGFGIACGIIFLAGIIFGVGIGQHVKKKSDTSPSPVKVKVRKQERAPEWAYEEDLEDYEDTF